MRFALLLILSVCGLEAREETRIASVTRPVLSANGELLVFSWMEDLWIGSSKDGKMKRLLDHPARESLAKFSPDGKRVVFCSTRTGSPQIFSANLQGGDLIQHSNHSEGHALEDISPDGKYALSRGYRAASGYRPNRLIMTDLQKDSREILLFNATAHSASISSDGSKILFCRGGEQLYRKGYRGSRASEIHCYDRITGKFELMIDEDSEARMPIWMRDGTGFYYLSNRVGYFNVWKKDLRSGNDTQLTFFKDDAVVYPALSGDGSTMVFVVGSKLYRFSPESGGAPVEIPLHTEEAVKTDAINDLQVQKTTRCTFSNDGSRVVFSAAGDLWTMAQEDRNSTRLTETDAIDEREPILSSDGTQLFSLVDNGVECFVVRHKFTNVDLQETDVLPSSTRSKRKLRLSPDGSQLSWLEATGDIVTYRFGGESARVVMPCWDTPTYDWSPDGKWLVVAAKDIHSNRDIWLVAADGSKPPFNLTSHPAFEGSPKWSPDGKKIVFTARRGADGLAKLWTMNIADDLGSDESMKKTAASVKLLETDISEPTRVVWDADSKGILFQSKDSQDQAVYRLDENNGSVEEYASFRGMPVGLLPNGSSAWRVDRVPILYDGKTTKEFRFSFSIKQQRSERQRLAFRKIWRTLAERFYDEKMAGVDWNDMLTRLENDAVSAREPWQFDRVVARLLGELNASHLTFKTKPWGSLAEEPIVKNPTAHSGLVFKDTWDGPLLIERVIDGSPISNIENPPLPGEIVKRIAGRDVNANTPLHEIFNGTSGLPFPIVIEDRHGKPRTLELVPVSYNRIRMLDRKTKEAHAKAMLADDDVVYLPFRKMSSTDLESLSVEVYRASLHAKGMILDLRDNAGGRVADELLGLFCQPKHTFTFPRSGPRGYPQDRRISPSWDGPLVVLCNENTFSNAEIFCHAFKRLQRGKLIGMPTNGGVISAVKVTIPELGELQVPFRGWFHVDTGKDLELNGAVPDQVIPILPQDQVSGNDPQLSLAIETLKTRIAEKRNEPEPTYKPQHGD